MIEINLLPEQTILSQKERRLVSRLAIWSVVVGMVVLTLFGAVFFVDRLMISRLENLERQQEELSSRFEQNIPRLTLLIGLKDKITGVSKVLAVRPDLPAAVEELKLFFVDGIEMKKLEMAADGGLRFSVDARDDDALIAFLDKMSSPMGKRFFKTLLVSGLGINDNGGSSFAVSSVFNIDFGKLEVAQ